MHLLKCLVGLYEKSSIIATARLQPAETPLSPHEKFMNQRNDLLSLTAIGHDLGLLLQIPGAMALVSILVVIGSGEWFTLPGFLVTVLLGLGGGQLLHHRCPQSESSPLPQPMIVVALGWLLIALLGALPFYMSAHLGNELSETTRAFSHPLNALFESMSGFTSTGLTMTGDPSTLPMSLQWWRSVNEWVGGVGVIILALALIEPAEDSYALYSAETRSTQLGESIKESARRIWAIFLGYTMFGIVIFYLSGMPFWESVNHGMTGIATGGFTITANSFRDYDTVVKSATILIMVLGAVSFPIHHALLVRGNMDFVIRHSQLKTFVVLFGLGYFMLVMIDSLRNIPTATIDQIFQWTSALGTCGFNSIKISTWSQPLIFLLTLGMFIGGMAGSTTGGLKVNRVTWLSKALLWRLRSFWIKDDHIERYFYDGEEVYETVAMRRVGSAALLACLYLTTLVIGTLVLFLVLGDRHSLYEVLFEATSALGGVGLSVGITSTDLSDTAKITLMLLMWMGRLEILAVLVLISSPFISLFHKR